MASSEREPPKLFVGLDIGTGGVRAVAVSETGQVAAQSEAELPARTDPSSGDRHEQDAESWWAAAAGALAQLAQRLRDGGLDVGTIQSLSIDGTSGTIVPVDAAGAPLRPALMYNDLRAVAEADELSEAGAETCRKLGARIAASHAIAKILWFARHEAELFEQTELFAHQADYIVGQLTGAPGVTDYSNALKTGYDLIDERWPAWLDHYPEIRRRLPRVVAPGTPVGDIAPAVAAQLQLSTKTKIVSGVTDGTAGFLASGACQFGQCNTTLGTTLVFKLLADRLCTHDDGLIYSHKLPGRRWLPGAASNTGGEWTGRQFAGADLGALDIAALAHLPCDHIAYPLARRGERFPIAAPQFAGFCMPPTTDPVVTYAANLQGTAFVERMCYETLEAATGSRIEAVFATGGGSQSDVWMQLRANATGRTLHRPACPQAAFGSAVLAASATRWPDLQTAIQQMVRIEKTFAPDSALRAAYDERYEHFKLLVDEAYADSGA